MYAKPELTLVGGVAGVVLGDDDNGNDNDIVERKDPGLVWGLDE